MRDISAQSNSRLPASDASLISAGQLAASSDAAPSFETSAPVSSKAGFEARAGGSASQADGLSAALPSASFSVARFPATGVVTTEPKPSHYWDEARALRESNPDLADRFYLAGLRIHLSREVRA